MVGTSVMKELMKDLDFGSVYRGVTYPKSHLKS